MDEQAISPDVENVEQDSYDELLMTERSYREMGKSYELK
jgi:hypothetical protein